MPWPRRRQGARARDMQRNLCRACDLPARTAAYAVSLATGAAASAALAACSSDAERPACSHGFYALPMAAGAAASAAVSAALRDASSAARTAGSSASCAGVGIAAC